MSSSPAKRRFTFSLRTFLLVTLVVSLILAYVGRVWLKAIHDRTPPTLAEMARIAVRHGLPMPDRDAQLVLAHTNSWQVINNRSIAVYAPGFLLKENNDGSIILLRGIKQETIWPQKNGEPLWLPFSLDTTSTPARPHFAQFHALATFLCAVQLAERGDQQRAQELLDRVLQGEIGSDIDEFHGSIAHDKSNLRNLIAHCALDHQLRRLLNESESWSDIRDRMEAIFDEFPNLKTIDSGWETSEHAAVYHDLVAALEAPAPKPDSVEALLLQWSRTRVEGDDRRIYRDEAPGDAHEPARRIVARGFEAIPGLIALLDDTRLTVHLQPRMMNGAGHIKRVKDLAAQLLETITAQNGYDVEEKLATADDWRKWWKSVESGGERAYLMQALFQRKAGRIEHIYEAPARILATRYPEALPPLCDEFCRLAGTHTQSFALAEAIAAGSLPEHERRQQLRDFAARGPLCHRRCALQVLAGIDPDECAKQLLPIIEELPADAVGPYWTCPEAAFTHVVMLLKDAAVWQAYLQAARRSSVGLRMEMMNPLDHAYIAEKNRDLRLAFLATFLDDETVRDKAIGDKFIGPCAAFATPRITVRDFAAEQIARILELSTVHPDASWQETQWSELRTKVKERLAEEKLPELE